MTIHLNGSLRDLLPGATIADVVLQLTPRTDGIAVARNGDVVRRSEWSTTAVQEGDRIEVLTARQGG